MDFFPNMDEPKGIFHTQPYVVLLFPFSNSQLRFKRILLKFALHYITHVDLITSITIIVYSCCICQYLLLFGTALLRLFLKILVLFNLNISLKQEQCGEFSGM